MTDPVIKQLADDLTKAQERGHSIEGVLLVHFAKLFLAFFFIAGMGTALILLITHIYTTYFG